MQHKPQQNNLYFKIHIYIDRKKVKLSDIHIRISLLEKILGKYMFAITVEAAESR
jgi:hypothetical protein